MKTSVLLVSLCLAPCFGAAQPDVVPDTLLIQTFAVDPSTEMLSEASGSDSEWVNWDGDELNTLCHDTSSSQPVPGSWYWDIDLGDLSDPPVNFAFTSCSYLSNPFKPNNNWLITPPVFIPDSTVSLSWKSLPFEGPAYMDGYKVVLSTNSNLPNSGDFDQTLFTAAQMTKILVLGSLSVHDYVFSPGYIHADSFKLTNYFFLYEPNAPSYSGKFEPHAVSLAPFAGKLVYIAFVHNSRDDSILQIDDIAIVHGSTSATTEAPGAALDFQIRPNPAGEWALARWNATEAPEGRLRISDCLGKTVLEKTTATSDAGSLEINLAALPKGIYTCTFYTSAAQQTVLLVKQ